jgi:hypothetical protein
MKTKPLAVISSETIHMEFTNGRRLNFGYRPKPPVSRIDANDSFAQNSGYTHRLRQPLAEHFFLSGHGGAI